MIINFLKEFVYEFRKHFSAPKIENYILIIVVTILSVLLLRIIIFIISRITKKRFSLQTGMLIKKAINYTGIFLIIIFILYRLKVEITPILGAAGIAGIAIGFAAQTSISNIISGIFLISEKPFKVGDLIEVDNKTGFIESIDLLSIKIRTFENLFIRIPNETMIKTNVINITRYPIRRVNIDVSVAYKENIKKVRDILMDTARKNTFCLDEPEPLFIFKNFGNSGLEILFGVWCVQDDWLNLKNSIMIDIKERFDKENIEIPFPHISLYSGSETDAFPVDIKNNK